MRILQVSNYYSPHIGGVEQVARDISNALKDEHEIKVLCFNHEKDDKSDFVDDVEIIRVGCFAKIASQSLSLTYYKNLKSAFKKFNPEVVIFHYPNPFAAHYLLKILKKYPECKLITYWHLDIVKQKILGKLFAGQTKRIVKKSLRILPTSPNYIEGSKVLSANKDKCTVVSCCVNIDRLKVNNEDIELCKIIKDQNLNKTICFAVGRHVPYKGMRYLVEASKYLDNGFKIYIGGEGELTESLKSLAKGDDKVCFLGKVAESTLKGHLMACDIFCFPSITKNEAFGIALAEAMLFGKPTVTFTIEGSGVNYVSLNGVTGIEVENANSQAFAEAIKKLAQSPTLCENLGQAAKQRVVENFTTQIFKENIIRIIEEIK